MFEDQYLDEMELDEAFCKEASERAIKANVAYAKEIKAYLAAPVAACSRAEALKLLKRFARKDFGEFWDAPVAEYLPAVSQGMMKLSAAYYPHDEALAVARELIADLSEKALARAFLYGVAHDAPEYRTALAAYFYVKNLPDHSFEPKYVGSRGDEEVYSEHTCAICDHRSRPSVEPKMRFWHSGCDMMQFYLKGSEPNGFSLNSAITILREYKKLPCPATGKGDYDFFMQIIDFIESQPANSSPSKLRKALKQSGLLKMTNDMIEGFMDMLGYLDILHPAQYFGVTQKHTPRNDHVTTSMNTWFAYPVCEWRGKDGVDRASVERLFGDVYD